MKIPFINLKAQFDSIRPEIHLAIENILAKGEFIMGENVTFLENEIGEYLGLGKAISVASGSDALFLALKAFDIGPGDEVITTPFSFISTADAILRNGATPIFADINPETYNIDPDQILKSISPRTKAIIPVHLYGQCAEMDRIIEIAKKHSLIVIEDACQAFGASYKNRKAGTWGDIGCFSFFPTKNLGGWGDGGMLVTSNENIAEKLKKLRVYGSKERHHHVLHGVNSRLDEIQAAILRIKLLNIDKWNKERQDIASRYNSLLKNLPLKLPAANQDSCHIYHLYTLRSNQRNEIMSFLNQYGIGTAVHYPKPIYLQPSYLNLGFKKGLCPIAEEAAKQIFAIPLYPELTDDMVNEIARTISDFFSEGISPCK